MVQVGTPEQYFGSPEQRIVISEPIPPIEAKVIEPVQVYSTQVPTPDYTPLIICVCFLGTICFLGFLAWTLKA